MKSKDYDTNRPLNSDELEALGRSLADADAGRVISGEAFFKELALLTVVALRSSMPGTSLQAGQTGTIVEHLSSGAYEVEFTDSFGNTLESRAFLPDQLVPVSG